MDIHSSEFHESPPTANDQAKPEPSEKICRICFDKDSSENPTITPCNCSGSSKFIHEECLKKWILSKTRNPKSFCCDVCKYHLSMEINQSLIPSCKGLKEEIFKILIFPIIISIVSTIVGLIFFYLVTSSDNPKINTSAKIYLSLVLFACLSIDITLIVMLFKAVKFGCCQLKVISWTIFQNPSQEVLNITSLTEIIEKPSTPVQPENEISMTLTVSISNCDSNEQTFTKLRDRIESRATDEPKSPTYNIRIDDSEDLD